MNKLPSLLSYNILALLIIGKYLIYTLYIKILLCILKLSVSSLHLSLK